MLRDKGHKIISCILQAAILAAALSGCGQAAGDINSIAKIQEEAAVDTGEVQDTPAEAASDTGEAQDESAEASGTAGETEDVPEQSAVTSTDNAASADDPDEQINDSYEDILFMYKEAQDGKYSDKEVERMGLDTELVQYGWPFASLNEEVRYLYYDLDSDGSDELIIIYFDDIADIYGFDGTNVRHAFSTPYKSIVELYPDGMLSLSSFIGMKYSYTTWYQYDSSFADFLPVFEINSDSENGESCYTFCAYNMSDEERKEVEDCYNNYGSYPVWLHEWSSEISIQEYEKLLPTASPVKLPAGEKIDDLKLPADRTPRLKPHAAKTGTIELTDSVQYEANIFISNFAEQRHNGAETYTLSADSDIYDLVYFAFKHIKMNSYDDLTVDGSSYVLSLEKVNTVLDRFFGITLSEEKAKEFYNDDYATTEYYGDGNFYLIAADGEIFGDIAVVKEINELEDGTYEMLFDVYAPSADIYDTGEKDAKALYHLRASEAYDAEDISWRTTGSAIVTPYHYNGRYTWRMVILYIDKQ